ncbi:hypothetical protein EDC62_0938 [Tibeticola sediminis]|uniref:Uncharacterized protein n=1 Tax=Tibeticola sediminis TaxID=1917811 RepID=A0A3N4V822_9BURK|nr:hypothetical protein EDC62_0938 [Tibeticola sediminis]
MALAGYAYLGSESQISTRFPYSRRYEQAQQAAGLPIYQRLVVGLKDAPPQNFRISTQLESLRGRDQALAAALVIGNETVSIEQFGNLRKLAVIIRGQAMVFDFKSMNVVRAYPLSFAYVDLLDHAPTDEEIDARVKLVFEGANGKPGLISRFVQSLSAAVPPASVSRFLQVTKVEIKPEANEGLPAFVRDVPSDAQTWAADVVAEAISTRVGVPIVPYSKGYAIGNVMSVRVSDGTVWELKLPKPDYEISVTLSGFRKIKFAEVAGGATSYVYGAYADLRIEEPLSGKLFFSSALKNGETRVIPASQTYVDDGPHFYDALNGLFVKTALAINESGDPKWIQSAASAKDISAQLIQVKELMKLCKQ